jgi:hypothetical protein
MVAIKLFSKIWQVLGWNREVLRDGGFEAPEKPALPPALTAKQRGGVTG